MENQDRKPPQRTNVPNIASLSEETMWEVLEAMVNTHSMKRVLHLLAEVAFQRGSDWREAARMIQTTAEAIPAVLSSAGTKDRGRRGGGQEHK